MRMVNYYIYFSTFKAHQFTLICIEDAFDYPE